MNLSFMMCLEKEKGNRSSMCLQNPKQGLKRRRMDFKSTYQSRATGCSFGCRMSYRTRQMMHAVTSRGRSARLTAGNLFKKTTDGGCGLSLISESASPCYSKVWVASCIRRIQRETEARHAPEICLEIQKKGLKGGEMTPKTRTSRGQQEQLLGTL